jgi:hypothetical protein
VNDALRVHIHDEEREDLPEPQVMELQEVAGPDRVVLEEGAPGLAITGRAWRSKEALNRALGDPDAELQELPATVFGRTMSVASRQVRQKALTSTIRVRSSEVSCGRRTVRVATMSCCRRSAFSASSSARVRNASRASPAAADVGRTASLTATRKRLLELKLVGDITGSFRVPRYQRGYR